MKLFQKLLVASTAVGLISPLAAQASDTVNLEEMNSYVRSEKASQRFDIDTFQNEVKEGLAKVNSRIDGLEARQNNFEAGGFSDTTVMDGKAVFTVGALDAPESGTNSSNRLSMKNLAFGLSSCLATNAVCQGSRFE